MPGIGHHTHTTPYADPVLRPPSPASSVGTAYEPDQTSHSDSEYQLSQPAFERKVRERIELDRARWEEREADRDPLIMVEDREEGGRNGGKDGNSKMVWVGSLNRKLDPEEEKRLFAQTMQNLRIQVSRLREDEIFDQILLRGSKAALEVQPSTDDIDVLMRSMMMSGPSGSGPGSMPSTNTVPGTNSTPFPSFGGSVPPIGNTTHTPGIGIGLPTGLTPHLGNSSSSTLKFPSATSTPRPAMMPMPTTGPGITNGPWNNFGVPTEAEREAARERERLMERERERATESERARERERERKGKERSVDGTSMLSGTTVTGKTRTSPRKASGRKAL